MGDGERASGGFIKDQTWKGTKEKQNWGSDAGLSDFTNSIETRFLRRRAGDRGKKRAHKMEAERGNQREQCRISSQPAWKKKGEGAEKKAKGTGFDASRHWTQLNTCDSGRCAR